MRKMADVISLSMGSPFCIERCKKRFKRVLSNDMHKVAKALHVDLVFEKPQTIRHSENKNVMQLTLFESEVKAAVQ